MKDRILALYDGELDEATGREVRAHLTDCPECRELYEGWEKTAKLMFAAPKPAASEFFVQSVMNRIHELAEPKRESRLRWNISLEWLVPAVGLALLFLAVLPFPSSSGVLTMETFLLQDTGGPSAIFLSGSAPTVDDTLQFVMEEPQ